MVDVKAQLQFSSQISMEVTTRCGLKPTSRFTVSQRMCVASEKVKIGQTLIYIGLKLQA